jgi:hypothetical protein
MSACHVNIIGRLTADPEAKSPQAERRTLGFA